MADEARAMLDALMGTSRDERLPSGASVSKAVEGEWGGSRRDKKSCYDRDICPLYCAWGIDVFDLFTNTKSDLGPNPYIVQEDSREEFVSLPDHEKQRLGYEYILFNKLGELVSQCDRIIARNKEKLRVEIAKNARAKGAGNNTDLATSVKEEIILDAAECIADLQLREEEVEKQVAELLDLEKKFQDIWKEKHDIKICAEVTTKDCTNIPISNQGPSVIMDECAKRDSQNDEQSKTKPSDNEDEALNSSEKEKNIKDDLSKGAQATNSPRVEKCQEVKNISSKNEDATKKINELKSKLYQISGDKQKILTSMAISTTQSIVPRREALQNLQKQLYYIRSDTSNDKNVCEISGNYMSSRDADERIAAHFAGKQYVGWKMVREKFCELKKKYNGRGLPTRGEPRGWGRHGNGPPEAPSYGNRNGPPPGRDSNFNHNRDRSRSRDRRSSRSGRSPSPVRWERDRNGYDHNRHNRRDDRGWGKKR